MKIVLPTKVDLFLADLDAVASGSVQSRLREAHGIGPAHCECSLPLSVCRRTVGKYESYYLRAFPNSKHRGACVFGSDGSASGATGSSAIRDGVLRIDGGLTIGIPVDDRHDSDQPPSPQRAGSSRRGYARDSLLSTFDLLWATSGLIRYSPTERRTTLSVVDAVYRAAATLKTPNGPLADRLVLVGAASDSPGRALRALRLPSDQRLVVIGELGEWPSGGGDVQRIFVKGLERSTGWHVAWKRPLSEATARRFARSIALLGRAEARVWFIALAEREPATHTLWAVRAAAVATTRGFVPVESSYELELASYLEGTQRQFGRAPDKNADLVPDFLLYDVGTNAFVIEVFGMLNDPQYAAHAAEKTAYYDEVYGPSPRGWWAWRVGEGDPPPLPAPYRMRGEG